MIAKFFPCAEFMSSASSTTNNINLAGDVPPSFENFTSGLLYLVVRFVVHLLLVFTLVHFVYGKRGKHKEFYFSYMAISVVVFVLCFLLSNVKIELGFALGLFAIFGIIRYRTDAIPIKEMTYLFVVIGISVINALANCTVTFFEVIFANLAIILALLLLEKVLFKYQEEPITLVYEKIENIHLENREQLIADLEKRTGISVERYTINRIDFMRDVAEITLYIKNNNTK